MRNRFPSLPDPRSARRPPLRLTAALTLLSVTAALGVLGGPVSARGELPLEEAPPVQPSDAGQKPAEEPDSEDVLLRKLFVYLKLSPQQMVRVMRLARMTERRRTALLAEEERALEGLDALEAQNPEEAARVRGVLEEKQAPVIAEIVGMTAPQLVPILTREQIALAWRLSQGQPPVYANADPALLHPSAGFATQAYRGFSLDGFALLGGAGGTAIRENISGVPGALGGDVAIEEERLRVLERLRAEDLDGLQRAGGRSGGGIWSARSPFLQRIAESNDPLEFLSVIEPLARRLFLSPEVIPVLQEMLAQAPHGALAAGERLPPSMGTLRLVRDYQMERGMGDLTGKGPELEAFGGRVQNGQYLFDPGQGLRLSDTGVLDHYAIEMSFRYFGGDNYQKLIDFKNGTKDIGLYFYQGHLTFYTLADGGIPQPGREHRLRLERNRFTRIVRVYLDFQPAFAFLDLDDEAVFDKKTSLLFLDDQQTKGEQGPGALRSVRLWGRPAAL